MSIETLPHDHEIQVLLRAKHRKGFNLDDLARRTKLSKRTIWRFFRGDSDPQISTVKKIAYALGLEYVDIRCDDPFGYSATPKKNAKKKAS